MIATSRAAVDGYGPADTTRTNRVPLAAIVVGDTIRAELSGVETKTLVVVGIETVDGRKVLRLSDGAMYRARLLSKVTHFVGNNWADLGPQTGNGNTQ